MKSSWVPYAVFVLALATTTLITGYVSRTTQAREQLGFEKTAESIVNHVEGRMATYIAHLRATRGLFTSSGDVTAAEFAAFYNELRLTEQFKGVLGIGYTRRVGADEHDRVVAGRRAQGLPEYDIWPKNSGEDAYVIYYLEPQNVRNLAAMGYNMITDATRREAMITARDTGSPTLSSRVTLVQEIDADTQMGFLLYFPVYRNGTDPQALAKRRETLTGFVYSAFRAGDLLETIASARQTQDLSYAVYDGGAPSNDALLYQSPNYQGSLHNGGRFRSVAHISIARHTWTVVSISTRQFDGLSDQHLAPITAYAGGAVSLLIFLAVLSQARARQQAESTTRQLERARAEAEEANRLKDQFLATVSHELRTPLNAISGWTQLLLEEDSLDDETRKGLSIIDRNARAQATLVDELLDVSRIISGRLRLQVEKTDLVRVVEDALETVQPAAAARRIMIEKNFQNTSAPLLADPSRLRQVVWNLLSNSIKFSPPGASMTVDLQPCPLGIELRVTDRGKGIAPDFLPYVFTAFRQADSGSARQHGGLGLGLAIVKQLVELHGGTVSAQSSGIDTGATFVVQLPLRSTEDSAPAEPTPVDETRSERSLRGAKLLVVDDEEDSRELMRHALQQKGGVVHVAGSAQEALEILQKEKIDVVVSDIGMPGTDGYALIKEVRSWETGRFLPAVAVTAYATDADRLKAEKAGFNLHLAKPIEPAVLQRAVARLLSE